MQDPVSRALKVAHKDTGLNIPESPETLTLQQKMVLDGLKPAMMFPTNTGKVLPLPRGLKSIETPEGTFHYNPSMIEPSEILAAIKAGRINDILGLGPFSKADIAKKIGKGESLIHVVGRSPEGHELAAAAGTPSTAGDQAAAIGKTLPRGSQLSVEAPQNVLIQRAMRAAQSGQ